MGVPGVELVNVDPFRVEPLQTLSDSQSDVMSRESYLICTGSCLCSDLGRNKHLLSEWLDYPSKRLFGFALIIHVGSVKQVNSGVNGSNDHSVDSVLVKPANLPRILVSESHGAESEK